MSVRSRSLLGWRGIHIRDWQFLLFWALLNLFQIATTELTSDEGYYWLFSTRLEWGYYEHPPMLALLIRAGSTLFDGEFGVRLGNVLVMTVGLGFFLRTLREREKPCAYVLLLGLPLLSYITFIAFPDSPLVGLAGIALYVYKRYLEKSTFALALLLALLVALMLYAKYHAILFAVFVVLSNRALLRRPHFYVAALVGVALYLPHLWWQHTHGYPSFDFHLVGRSSGVFYFHNLLDFSWQQFLVIGVGVIWIPFVRKARTPYETSLRYVAIGTLLFFALGTFRGYVHMHWTAIALLPIVHLAAGYYAAQKTATRFALLVWPNVLFVLLLRLYFAFPVLPANKFNVDTYHGRALWAEDIHAVAGDRPVVFETGYRALRQAPLYQFYAGGWSMALYPLDRKRSQYQIWGYEERVQGKAVMLITEPRPGTRALQTRMGSAVHYRLIDDFVSYNSIVIEYEVGGTDIEAPGRKLALRILNHRARPLAFRPQDEVYVELVDEDGYPYGARRSLSGVAPIESGGRATVEIFLEPGEIPPGSYEVVAGLTNPYTIPSQNSRFANLTVR